ncbi:MAG: nickel pincer cofactor biosynthesis protein LarB [Kiritimatiellae bacterium]|nr:nickel pincer cofactor biosynthesis protein LarB [Kiritimatiellia bacterium]
MTDLHKLLEQVARGEISPGEAAAELNRRVELGLGYARLDLDRRRRCGVPEVVFGPGKTVEQIVEIARQLLERERHVMASRVSAEQARALCEALPGAVYHSAARCVTADLDPLPPPRGRVAVVSGGTADLPVGEEAAITAERMGAAVDRIWDCGVAGLHRLLPHLETLRRANAVIVAAGMEGALPSVVGGLVDRPVIAVPVSVGYGAHLGGLAPLLTMLNSCVPGVTVVNVDNGFGAGVAAGLINRLAERGE